MCVVYVLGHCPLSKFIDLRGQSCMDDCSHISLEPSIMYQEVKIFIIYILKAGIFLKLGNHV